MEQAEIDDIIAALEQCSDIEHMNCVRCPYIACSNCVQRLMRDALRLILEKT